MGIEKLKEYVRGSLSKILSLVKKSMSLLMALAAEPLQP
jgi:hypothetical protein